MAIQNPEPPEASEQEAMRGLQQLRKDKFSADVMGGAAPVLSDAHQVFTLGPSEINAGAGLDAAKAAGWRYLIGQPASVPAGGSSVGPLAVAEVSDQNGVYKFAQRQEGWLAKQTRQTMDIAAKLPAVNSGAYEIRMLRLPAISRIDALWLKNKGAGSDLIIPIASNSPDLVAGKSYTSDNFLTLVRALAKKPVFDNSPKSSESSSR
jgi:hypothetical protein